MKTELANYEILPKIVPSDIPVEIMIRPLGAHAAFEEGEEHIVKLLPMSGGECAETAARVTGGVLRFRHAFPGEQEHSVRIFRPGPGQHRIAGLSVYSLLPDLYGRRPYRGDFHAHSFRSDGKEAPEVLPANYRKAGFDFMAVTDHGRWRPSCEAIDAWTRLPADIALFHGEEVHTPGNHIHIVNFGGSFSVNERALHDEAAYRREVEDIRAGLGALPDGVDGFEYAACLWTAGKIREGGGLGIFCHPHWISDAYHVPDAMTWHILETMPLDAFELLGGQSVPENNMQTAIFQEARARGFRIPIVASSDSHGTVNADWFNWVSTVVFSETLSLPHIISAVKQGYSAAMEHYPGEHPRAHGPYRMAAYAMFLLREYWPLHDELCFEQGRAMKDFICGDESALGVLNAVAGRVGRFREKCFGGK